MKKMDAARQSNFEVVRIIAMSMIVLWHFLCHGTDINYYSKTSFLIPVLIGGVDLFILISGYFLINIKLKSILKLCTILVVFSLINYFAVIFANGGNILSITNIGKTLRIIISPISPEPYWFIQVYFGLLFFSPFLNKGLKAFDIKELRKAVVVLTLFQIYGCFILENMINLVGYQIYNFLYLYILGYYIRREKFIHSISTHKLTAILIILFVISELLVITFLFSGHGMLQMTRYNNPLIILTDICILILCSRLKLHSNGINRVAGCALGVYLLQDGVFGYDYFYPFMQATLNHHGIGGYLLLCIVTFFSLWILSYVITMLTDRIFSCPIAKLSNMIK